MWDWGKKLDNTILLTYQEVLEKIKDTENHLLLGNGFNYGLGVKTGYKYIFDKMKESNHGIYSEAQTLIEECEYDLESFLERLSAHILPENTFLKKYVYNKVKLDFMQALQKIVKSKIKHIYEEKNEGIFILLEKFTNYFTLNYDSFLYLLLLKFKPIPPKKDNSIAFLPTFEYMKDDFDKRLDKLYTEIKQARDNGKLEITMDKYDIPTKRELSLLTKAQFTTAVNAYNKAENKGWKDKDISRVIDRILEEEKKHKVLSHVDDGSRQLSLFENEIVFDVDNITQNLFFLHGAFHIIQDGEKIKKITQETDKALYNKLE